MRYDVNAIYAAPLGTRYKRTGLFHVTQIEFLSDEIVVARACRVVEDRGRYRYAKRADYKTMILTHARKVRNDITIDGLVKVTNQWAQEQS